MSGRRNASPYLEIQPYIFYLHSNIVSYTRLSCTTPYSLRLFLVETSTQICESTAFRALDANEGTPHKIVVTFIRRVLALPNLDRDNHYVWHFDPVC